MPRVKMAYALVKREKWKQVARFSSSARDGGPPAKVALRESAIHVPKVKTTSRKRELTPAPCPGLLMDAQDVVKDLEWCLDEASGDWDKIEPYVTFCQSCQKFTMKRMKLVDLLAPQHRRDRTRRARHHRQL